MKKLIIKTISYLLTVAAIVLIPSAVIDPYNVFHAGIPKDNGIESNKSFIKTEYLRKHHDEFDSLLFGSSRAGFVDIDYLNEVSGGKFYDMASSESLVNEQVVELKTLIDDGFIPKRVWVMVDDISCFVDPAVHENMLYRVPYPGSNPLDRIEFYLKYMDVITCFKSLSVINETKLKQAENSMKGIDDGYDSSTGMTYLDRFYHTGTERLDKDSHFNPEEEQYQKGYWVNYYSLREAEALEDMKDMVKLCDEYGIELTVVTNPLYKLTYQMDVENGYLKYLKGLAEVTDYYNFSSFNDITEDYSFYYETSHFMPSVTRMMIDCVYGEDNLEYNNKEELKSQGFGVLVTKDNSEDVVSLLKKQADERNVSYVEE